MASSKTNVFILEDEPSHIELLKSSILSFCKSRDPTRYPWPQANTLEFRPFTEVDPMIGLIKNKPEDWKGSLLFLDLNIRKPLSTEPVPQGYEILKELYNNNLYENVTKVIYSGLEPEEIIEEFKSLPITATGNDGENPFSDFDICEFLKKPIGKKTKVQRFLYIFKYHDQLVKRVNERKRINEHNFQKLEKTALVGNCYQIKEVLQKTIQLALTEQPILLLGETGVGKTILAEEIHNCSKRSDKDMITIDVSKLPGDQNLRLSELFGHEKGAYTGATEKKEGDFFRAHESTIFIDEIGELDKNSQKLLLRVLNNNKIRPLGSKVEIDVDVRIVAATHKNIQQMVENKEFREDLFYRLGGNFSEINIPPLRERREDMEEIVTLLLKRNHSKFTYASPELIDYFKTIDFNGNLRDLNNLLAMVDCLCEADRIDPIMTLVHINSINSLRQNGVQDYDQINNSIQEIATLPSASLELQIKPYGNRYHEALDKFKRNYVVYHLKASGENKSQTANTIGISRQSLDKILKKNNLKGEQTDE